MSAAPPSRIDWPSIETWLDRCYPAQAGVRADGLARWLADPARPAPLLLDVRSAREFEVSRLPGARHAATVDDALAAIAAGAGNGGVVAYCSVGIRSARLVAALEARGIAGAINLRGSIFAWANAGLPLVDRVGPATPVHPFDAAWGRLLDAARRAPVD